MIRTGRTYQTMLSATALATLFATALAAAPRDGATGSTFAVRGATVHTVDGPVLSGVTVVIVDGKIQAVSTDAAIPEGATVVDAAGRHLVPGFIHPFSTLGLAEIDSVRGSVDRREVGDNNANLRAEVAFNADSMLLLPAIQGGVVAAHVVPAGGLYNGTSAVLALDGWNWKDMTLAAPSGFHISYPRTTRSPSPWNRQTPEEFEKEKKKALDTLERLMEEARGYDVARAAMESGKGPAIDFDPTREPFRAVFAGTIPVYLRATTLADIRAALDWAAAQRFGRVVLVAGSDARHVSERLAKDDIAVILDGVLTLPPRESDPYDESYGAAAALAAAGVRFAIGDRDDSSNARNLPFHAAMAVAFGLPRDAALRAITLAPAEILGVADRMGSITPGKRADLVLLDGDPLEVRSRVERVWIDGDEIDLGRDRQRQLYERYDARPPREH